MSTPNLETLNNIQQRILWLSTYMLHYANKIRPNPDGSKIGGHQASSASTVTLTTALLFHFLRSDDRFQFKPHGSPAYHSAMYLMDALPKSYMTGLREFGKLQSYLSRSKDPVVVDFSNGSMGLGCAAPVFAATAQHYAQRHFGDTTAKRFITISGDAELDEGNIYEMLLEESMRGVNNVLWIVDLNRQSLDRVVPGIRAKRLEAIFAACGWDVIEAKYGQRLQTAFASAGGEHLRQWIDDMSNEEYQSLIRSDGPTIRGAAMRSENDDLIEFLAPIPDDELVGLISNLGGCDLAELIAKLDMAAQKLDAGKAPVVLFAYTIKGWGLPLAGDPFNHSALLSDDLIHSLFDGMGIDRNDPWLGFAPGTPEYELCQRTRERLGFRTFTDAALAKMGNVPVGYGRTARRNQVRPVPIAPADVPAELGVTHANLSSTQDAFGRVVMRLADVERIAPRIITTSADVATSTNLGGWINKVGMFSFETPIDYEAGRPRPINWRGRPEGQHVELGIAEMNLYMMLSQLGLSHELNGQLLLPIGTLYDPFVCRGLDALIFGLYSESKFIFAATPSGTTLSPEGGAHQSAVTASLGIELPNLDYYEPCFGVEVEWALMEGLRQLVLVGDDGLRNGRSTYLRMSTKNIDQSLLKPALDRLGKAELRRKMLGGGYRLRLAEEGLAQPQSSPILHLITCGAMIPEVLAAADYLQREGVAVNVINLTNPRGAYESWKHAKYGAGHILEELIPVGQRHAPILTVHDAASHAFAWLGSVFGQRVISLGVDKFGQSGTRAAVYEYVGIDTTSIIAAGFRAVD
ncbi:MAG: pyruvate dehydrogenase [Anaerolineae bacterium]|nr:pyruvate dehydrogenase [Anaerolineae bacterium]